MPLLATAKQPTSKLDAGSYTVTCTGIIEDALPDSKFNDEIYRFYFEVDDTLDEEGNQATTDAISSRTLSPKSKLWSWLVAFGLKPEVGKVIDLESVVGRRVMVVVTPSDDGQFNRVTSLVPLPKGAAQKAPTGPVEGAEPPLADALAEAAALANWFEEIKSIGYSTKEILDHATGKYGKTPKDMTAAERDELAKDLTGVPF